MTLIKPLKPRSKRDRLEEAHALLQAGQKRTALDLLVPIVQDQPNDADAWWLFANATPRARDAELALQHILRLEPHNARAQHMLAQLRASNVNLREAQARAANASQRIGYQEVACVQCGARTRITENMVIERCSFCGSQNLISPEGDALQDQLNADGLIPFVLNHHQCIPLAKQWLARTWMTPDSLRHRAEVGIFVPMYLPFYAISSDVRGTYRITQTHQDRNGDYRTRTLKRGELHMSIRHILLAATHRLGEVLPGQMADYRMERAIKFHAERLKGMQVQLPDIPAYELAEEAHTAMLKHIHQNIPAGEHALGEVELYPKFVNDRWLTVLLPAFLTTYRYHGKVYKIMINGQTGRVTGQLPVDWVKVWAVVAVMLAPGVVLLGIAVALNARNDTLGIATSLLMVSGILGAMMVLWQAFTLDDA